MLERAGGRAGWFLEVCLLWVWATTGGCAGGDDPAPVAVARNRLVGRPAEVRRTMRPLAHAPDSHPAPDTGLAFTEGLAVDARVLVITADGTDAAVDAITQTLRYLGTPFDVLNATTGPALNLDDLVVADHGRYYAIVLDVGDLAVGNQSAFTDSEWMTLASYEARFGVRRAALYAFPTEAYGLTSTGGGFDASTKPVAAHCTPAGAAVFVGANCAVPVAIDDAWVYGGQAIDAATTPLLVDDAGVVYAATRTYPDGREALAMTFSQSPTSLPSLELAYGVLSWVTRGLFIGERHVYLAPQIDDFFLASALYATNGTYRITADDLQAFTNWQAARQADPLTAQFRAAFAFNAQGAQAPGRDGLTDKALALGPTFAWINHTWDHAEMDAMSYANAFSELNQNNQYGIGSGLSRYSALNLVTPSMTGLGNAEVMRAAYDVGIRQVISDATVHCEANPSPNAGYYNALVPTLLQIPRRATDLYFNVSQPAEWIAEYEALRSTTGISYPQILDVESTEQLRFLMRGETDPWMFHQANLRDLGGGQSLITAFLDAVLAKYAARATFPIASPTMDELAQKTKARMWFDASGVSATIEPGGKLTVQVTRAATIPVTGLCTPAAEAYAGQQISYLQLGDGQSITLSLADCNADFNPMVPPPPGGADADGGTGSDVGLPPGPTVGGNCPPATGTGGAGGSSGAGGSRAPAARAATPRSDRSARTRRPIQARTVAAAGRMRLRPAGPGAGARRDHAGGCAGDRRGDAPPTPEESGELGDASQLVGQIHSIEPPQLGEQPHGLLAREEAALQRRHVPASFAVGGAVALALVGVQIVGVDDVTVETPAQAGRRARHEKTARELVDLRLQLQLQLRDGPRLRRAQRQVDEVAHALDGQAEVGEVFVVETRRRIVLLQVRERRGVDEQRHRQLAVRLAQQELLARRARRPHLVTLVAVDDERVDRQLRLDPIQRLQPELQPRQQRRRALTRMRHCRRPSPFSGITPSAASRAATLALFVRCHCR